jgi:hypothetical protein
MWSYHFGDETSSDFRDDTSNGPFRANRTTAQLQVVAPVEQHGKGSAAAQHHAARSFEDNDALGVRLLDRSQKGVEPPAWSRAAPLRSGNFR